MVSIKAPNYLDDAIVGAGSIRCVGHRRAKTRSAAKKAQRIAAWVAAQMGSNPTLEQERPDEHAFFAALQTCAYRATRNVRGKAVMPAERDEWAERWRLIRDYLIDRNLGLAYKMLGRFRASQVDWDDLRSEAFLALVRATEWFNPWRGFRFSTYACHAIVRALIQAARKSCRYPLQLTVEPETRCEPGSPGDRWLELYVDRLRRALHENRGNLTKQESTILAQRFPADGGSGRTLSQVGNVLGLSKERIRQIQKTALGKLRHVLEGDPVLQ